MNLLKEIFARLWALWSLLWFIVTFLIVLPVSKLADRYNSQVRGQAYFINVARIWMRVWLFVSGFSLKVTGRQHFKNGQTYIVVFNHNALLDVPLSAPFVPGPNKTIAKSSFTRIPLFGWYYSRGSVLVDRQDENSRTRSFEAMRQVLRSGMHMAIYPEGTRNRTNKPLKNFYDGAFKLSIETGKDIIPCIIHGTRKAMPPDKTFYLLPTPLKMQFLAAISPVGETVSSLKDKVFRIMEDHYTARDQKSWK